MINFTPDVINFTPGVSLYNLDNGKEVCHYKAFKAGSRGQREEKRKGRLVRAGPVQRMLD